MANELIERHLAMVMILAPCRLADCLGPLETWLDLRAYVVHYQHGGLAGQHLAVDAEQLDSPSHLAVTIYDFLALAHPPYGCDDV